MSLFTIFFLYILALAHAAPLVKRIVVSPPITSPTASTVWNVGDKVLVTWDTSDIPEPKNFTGQLLLGFQENDSENLMLDSPLASGFQLIDGQVQIIVPNVAPKSDYIVVLFGDSGNASPEFTISGGASSSSAASPAPASTSAAPSTSEAPSTSDAPSALPSPSPSLSESASAAPAPVSSAVSAGNNAASSASTAKASASALSSAASTSATSTVSSLPDQGNVGTNTTSGAMSHGIPHLTLPSFIGFAAAAVFFL